MCVEETEEGAHRGEGAREEVAEEGLPGGRDGSHNKVATVTLLKQRWFRSMLHAFMSCSVIMQM
jgi:hypothetical protein